MLCQREQSLVGQASRPASRGRLPLTQRSWLLGPSKPHGNPLRLRLLAIDNAANKQLSVGDPSPTEHTAVPSDRRAPTQLGFGSDQPLLRPSLRHAFLKVDLPSTTQPSWRAPTSMWARSVHWTVSMAQEHTHATRGTLGLGLLFEDSVPVMSQYRTVINFWFRSCLSCRKPVESGTR